MNVYAMLFIIGVSGILFLLFLPLYIVGEQNKKKIRQSILSQLNDLFTKHLKIQIGMSEQDMIDIMKFRYDRSCEESKNTYRFVYITKGSSGETHGYMGTSYFDNHQYINGSIHGSSESHDESIVIIECKDGKVTKIQPYNMNNINIPASYSKLLKFADSFNIKYR